jgi:DMSO/TMAO reductase YedYZ molybdopterin-dependent catalytic subunit
MTSRPGRCTSTAARSWPGAARLLGAGLVGGKAQAQDAWDLTPTSYDDATSYNNFYEFGTDKGDPARHAHQMTTAPWSVEIDGMVDNPGTYSSRISSPGRPSRNASIACAAWSGGRW